MEYADFLKTKQMAFHESGFDYPVEKINAKLFDWQKDIVHWAIKKGKAALFEDCGLGKTPQQLEYARIVHERTNKDVLIVAPLAVSQQTKREGQKFCIDVNIARSQIEVKRGINVTNYEILEHFDAAAFSGIVLDESSILKHQSSKTRQYLTDTWKMQYQLACTATPAPNDFMELGNHSDFFGIMTQPEMLSTFFVHDGGDTAKWRLKGHAEDKFWEWIASWACVLQNPSDLGYEQDGFELPELKIHEHIVKAENMTDGNGQFVFISDVIKQTLNDRRAARRNSIDGRTDEAAKIAYEALRGGRQVLIWCDLNTESELLAKKIDGSVEVRGSDSSDYKTESMLGFSSGDVKCLISKPSICGWGMNWQNCADMIFVGLSDSFEAYYQAVRRCWRFGQKNPVNVHIVISENEGAVKQNIERKQKDAQRLMDELVEHTKKILYGDIRNTVRISESYNAFEKIILPEWLRSA